MHILYLCETFDPQPDGGAGRVAGDLAKEMVNMGMTVDVICPNHYRRVCSFELEKGLNIHHVPAVDQIYSKRMLREIASYLSSKINLLDIDIFHDNGSFFKMLYPLEDHLLSILKDVPFILQCQIQWRPILIAEQIPNETIIPLVEKQKELAHRANHVIFLSREEQEEGLQTFLIDESKTSIVPNAIPLDRFPFPSHPKYSFKDGIPVIAMAGRLRSREKGTDIGLEVLSELSKDVDFQLMLIGNKMDINSIPENLRQRTFMTGWINSEEMAQTLSSADILIVPSRYEAFGLIAVEAMAVGTAVVASATGGLKDIITHEKTGLLAETQNLKDNLKKQLLRFFNDDTLKNNCIKNGLSTVKEKYTISLVAKKILDIYFLLQTTEHPS